MVDVKVEVAENGRTGQQLLVLAILLLIYVSVPVAASVFAIWQLFPFTGADGDPPRIDEHWFISFLGVLSSPDKSILELVHKLILPFAALFVGSNINRLRAGWPADGLFMLPLVGVIASLLAAVLFDAFMSTTVRAHFGQLPVLLTDMASNLGIFTLLMIGINMEAKK